MLNRYSTIKMRELWSERSKYEHWFKVELAVCKAMEQTGYVPEGTASKLESIKLDPDRITIIEETTKHDVIAFLTHIEELAGENSRWLHLGLTSSDVLDTAFALQLVKAADLILLQLRRLIELCTEKARKYIHTPMIGRSHGIHAEPTSLGLMFARWRTELIRNAERLIKAKNTVSTGKISGAVGNYSNIKPEVEAIALESLGLKPETVATQVVSRDRHAEYFSSLGILAASVESMAITLRHMQRTEVSEAFEPFGKGQKGSSAMPHKRNPILCENVTGLARTIRSEVAPSLENMLLWHERDISHSSVERMIAPDATSLSEFMLKRMSLIIEGLEIKEENLIANINLTNGLVFSQTILLELVKRGYHRQKAYEAVQRCAMKATSKKGDFKDLLLKDPLISKEFSETEIDQMLDVTRYLRYAEMILDRALQIPSP